MNRLNAIAAVACDEGVQAAFNLPDEVTIHIAEALRAAGIPVLRPRHEQTAVAMADGFSRASASVPICCLGPGPAIAQTATGLMTAQRARSAMVILLGRTPAGGNIKAFDEPGFIELLGLEYMCVRGQGDFAGQLHDAFHAARVRSRPVVVDVGELSELERRVERSNAGSREMTRGADCEPEDADASTISKAADLLAKAERPLLIAGWGAVASSARSQIEELANRTGALVANTLKARGFFAEHPRDIGTVGGFATPASADLLAEADCVIAVGASLNRYQTAGQRPGRGALVQIDRLQRPDSWIAPDLLVVGDAARALSQLNAQLEQRGVDGSVSPWLDRAPDLPALRVAPTLSSSCDGAIPVSVALRRLDELLPQQRVVIADGGLFFPFLVDQVRIHDPHSWFWSADFGAIGLGLGVAMGVAVARRGERCVLVAGDGGLAMSLQELDTVAREEIPLTIVALNDAAFSAEVRQLGDKPKDLALFSSVDFAAVASAHGIRSLTIRRVDEFQQLERELDLAPDSPLVVDIKVSETEDHRAIAPGIYLPLRERSLGLETRGIGG